MRRISLRRLYFCELSPQTYRASRTTSSTPTCKRRSNARPTAQTGFSSMRRGLLLGVGAPAYLPCRYVRTRGAPPLKSQFWGGGKFNDKRRARDSTQTESPAICREGRRCPQSMPLFWDRKVQLLSLAQSLSRTRRCRFDQCQVDPEEPGKSNAVRDRREGSLRWSLKEVLRQKSESIVNVFMATVIRINAPDL